MELGVAKLVALEEDALFVDFFGDANEAGVVGNGFEAAEDAAPVEAGEGLELGLAGAEADDGVGEFEGFGAAKFGGVCFGPGAGALHAVGDLTVQVGEDLGVTAAEVVEGEVQLDGAGAVGVFEEGDFGGKRFDSEAGVIHGGLEMKGYCQV